MGNQYDNDFDLPKSRVGQTCTTNILAFSNIPKKIEKGGEIVFETTLITVKVC